MCNYYYSMKGVDLTIGAPPNQADPEGVARGSDLLAISSGDLAVDAHELAHVGLPLLESDAVLLRVHLIVQGVGVFSIGRGTRVPLVLGLSTLLRLLQEDAVLFKVKTTVTISIASLEIISDLLHHLLDGGGVLPERLILVQGFHLVLLGDVGLPELIGLVGDAAIAFAHLGGHFGGGIGKRHN